MPFEVLHQAEVGDLDAVADQKQVARLDVEVLEAVLLDEVIEAVGGVAHVAEQFVARDAGPARLLVFDVQIVQALVGQFHDDDQFAADDVDAFDREDERVADFLDPLQGLVFLLGTESVAVEGIEVAVDELDGLVDAAGGDAFPHLAEPAGTHRSRRGGSRAGLPHRARGTSS